MSTVLSPTNKIACLDALDKTSFAEVYIDFVIPNDVAAPIPRPRDKKYAIIVPAVSAYLLSTNLEICKDIREVKIPRFRCTGTSSVILFY
jgi:hypothetical protein